MTPISTLQSELDLGNQYLLMDFGDRLALGFRGTADFIRRSFTFAKNTRVTMGELHRLSDDLSYVLIDSQERLLRGLKWQSYVELLSRATPLKEVDVEEGTMAEYDEESLEAQADQAARAFLAAIPRENFRPEQWSTEAEIYRVALASNAKNTNYRE